MRRLLLPLLAIALLSCAAPPRDAGPPPDAPRDDALRAPIDSAQRTQVLVLGTEHLVGLGENFAPGLLAGLLQRLEAFRPDVIAVETLPPAEVDRLVRRAELPGSAAGELVGALAARVLEFAGEARAGLDAAGLDTGEIAALLARHASLEPAERRLLVARLLAGYDLPSASLQWAYLPEDERRADELITPALAAALDQWLDSANEIVSIGVTLALRLGLPAIASIDDHTDSEVGLESGLYAELMPELEQTDAYVELLDSEYFKEATGGLALAAATGDLLARYRRINSPEYLAADVAAQWHLFYRTELESGRDRARVALWEARNLNIASRVRQASAMRPGGRVLVVIGVAHKPFLDRYLGQMMEVDIVPSSEVLGHD
jgi:hypothetical protein